MTETKVKSWPGIVAGLISFATAFVYVLEVRPDLDLEPFETATLSVFIGILVFGSLALAGAFTPDPGKGGNFLLGAGLGLLVLGLMGLLSIGLPLLVAGVLALVEGFRRRPSSGPPDDEQRGDR